VLDTQLLMISPSKPALLALTAAAQNLAIKKELKQR
jgi:hypothetical protein